MADILEHCRAADADPGSGLQYNNCDTSILGKALEAVTGKAADLLAIDNALLDGRLISKALLERMLAGDPCSGYAALSVWSYEPDLEACLGKTRLVERFGEINGVQVRNFLLPDRRIALAVNASDRRVSFGEIWRGGGLSIALLRAAACG